LITKLTIQTLSAWMGATTGGNPRPFGWFRHNKQTWVVHLDTHYEPLRIARDDAVAGNDPFVEKRTDKGRLHLVLTPALQARQQTQYQYLYIYAVE
jgi:hypothetical protein